MKKYDEISSTERLLELIRDNNKSDYKTSVADSQGRFGHRFKNLLNIPLRFRKTISVGVDLGHDDLKMIKIHRVSDHKFRLLGFVRIPYDPDITMESPHFYQFLKPILVDFCGYSKNIDILIARINIKIVLLVRYSSCCRRRSAAVA